MDKLLINKLSATDKAEYHKKYYEDNKEKLSAYRKQWHIKNKERRKKYEKDNHERILKQQQARHNTNPEKRREDWQKWYEMNKIRSPKRRFTEAKHTAEKRKIEWFLTLEEYIALLKLPCYYCENKLGTPVLRSIGLDRLTSDKGYETSNVVSCCYTCNVMKHTFLTPEEMKFVATALIKFREERMVNVEMPT